VTGTALAPPSRGRAVGKLIDALYQPAASLDP